MNIRAWLRKQPQPSKLRADGKDVAITDGKWKWAEAERSILALDPERLEALDASGVVLRVCTLDDEGATDEKSDAKTAKESELVLVARELRIAADESAARHEQSYRYAFDTIAAMFNAQSTRLAGLETAWQKMVMANAQAGAGAGDESLLGLFAQFMAGRDAGAAAPANGAKAKK